MADASALDELTIRDARAADVTAVRAFGERVVPAHYAPILGPQAAARQVEMWWREPDLAVAIEAGNLLLVERPDGDVVGVGELGESEGERVIWKLYLDPAVRGAGVGVCLVEQLIARLPSGTPAVVLEHMAGNVRAAAFYEREGFHLYRIDENAEHPEASTVWRRRLLRAAVD